MLDDILASVAWLLLVAGWTQRRTRSRHVPLVLAGIGLDLALVAHLELSRAVVERTMAGDLPWTRWAHVGTSSLAVALYVPVLWYGLRLLRGAGGPDVQARHRALATAALAMRTLGFVFMWAAEAAPRSP